MGWEQKRQEVFKPPMGLPPKWSRDISKMQLDDVAHTNCPKVARLIFESLKKEKSGQK